MLRCTAAGRFGAAGDVASCCWHCCWLHGFSSILGMWQSCAFDVRLQIALVLCCAQVFEVQLISAHAWLVLLRCFRVLLLGQVLNLTCSACCSSSSSSRSRRGGAGGTRAEGLLHGWRGAWGTLFAACVAC
jgi:hypothetical protein